ncbi:radical SAM/SPASM domain-containing protein [Micromonospora globispora]|uniref:Radical SAM/SPASM domain-containing protein n=1 Tax=Micromonospora globispora TaxID=1450148 RepID=A0A317JRT2_9ACTN|nr:TIGR04053 family radical SAM/SPASM domain-containing protein [Micromonospora globispora]PWU43541.1 radical SAM/SPASM domain-containing protein [Micromonospora globispora]PWU58681.1 radical SAM/SPASM domain-containing protein [Micromonospora globispora]RQW94612.1 radical SAM/SPASM domain-containing protein [Micromonospora globispora]
MRVPKRDVAERPFIVIWEATQACPLACLHCRASARPNRDRGELDTDEAVRLMAQVAEFGRPAPLFVITGGDPFQRPDLETLVRRGTELGLPVSVSPSGTPTLTAAALAGLHRAGARAVSLSLDAAEASGHDGFRGVPGVYDLTVRAWREAVETGLKVQINTTVTRDNVLDLPRIAAQVRDRGAMLWSVFFLVPTGRGRALHSLDAAETEDVLNALYDLGENVPVKTTEAHHFRRVCLQRAVLAPRGEDPVRALGLGPLYRRLRQELDELALTDRPRRPRRPPLRVSAGNGFVFVSHRGDVHPSGFLPVPAGNVRDRSLVDLYRTSELFTGLRDPHRLQGRCGACEFRAVCGGSRARAFATTGDVYAEEPACAYRPGSFGRREELAAVLAGAAPTGA